MTVDDAAASAPVIMVDEVRIWPNARGIFRKGSAHLTVDGETPHHIEALHAFAALLRMKRGWFQDHHIAPHYDLTPAKRRLAIQLGAVEVSALEQARRRMACV